MSIGGSPSSFVLVYRNAAFKERLAAFDGDPTTTNNGSTVLDGNTACARLLKIEVSR